MDTHPRTTRAARLIVACVLALTAVQVLAGCSSGAKASSEPSAAPEAAQDGGTYIPGAPQGMLEQPDKAETAVDQLNNQIQGSASQP